MHRSFSFWSWLLALLAMILAMLRHFAGTGDAVPGGPDDGMQIPPLNPVAVAFYAYQGCTDQEIADRFLVDVGFVRREFATVLRSIRGLRAMRLREAQTKLALNGNGPALIWLGRNELGQSNNPTDDDEPPPHVTD